MKKILTILLVIFSFLQSYSQSLAKDVTFASSAGYHSTNFSKGNLSLSLSSTIEQWMRNKKPERTILGYTQQNRAVEVYYFPGTSNQKALVIGGMHGSELSSIEMAKQLIEFLSEDEMPYYNVIVIPVLFPDNAEKAMTNLKCLKDNLGRYTTAESVDPNRQMPELGKPFRAEDPVDLYGRTIEMENQYLLQLIQVYQPTRIANFHAIKDVSKSGVFADPRTNCNGYALGFETDSSLAISMASFIENSGGKVIGNHLQQSPTALYYNDPEIALRGFLQKRNLNGSSMPNNRGSGVSLGGWAATAVCDDAIQRDAVRLITVEFPAYLSSSAYEGREKRNCVFNLELYAMAIKEVFLSGNWVE
jgi:Zinc carboxypeptidase